MKESNYIGWDYCIPPIHLALPDWFSPDVLIRHTLIAAGDLVPSLPPSPIPDLSEFDQAWFDNPAHSWR